MSLGLDGLMLVLVLTLASTAPATDDSEGPRSAVQALIDAAYQADPILLRRLLHPADADQAMCLDAAVELILAKADYESAMLAHFGPAAVGTFGVPWLVSPQALNQAKVTIESDQATIRTSNGARGRQLVLHRVKDQWKVELPGVLTPHGFLPADEPVRRYADMTEVFREASQAVRQGRFVTADQASSHVLQASERAFLGRDAQ